MAGQSLGICSLCGERKSKRAMAAHLGGCAPKHDAPRGGNVEWIQLRVEGGGPYWLDVEASSKAQLKDLDRLLRNVWLECCGHMSAFFVGRKRPERLSEYPMNATVGEVFGGQREAAHYEYDFGSTTELAVRAVSERTGRGDRKAGVRVLARNEAPHLACEECGEPASEVCPFSQSENPFLCPEHTGHADCDEHECHLPVVNSPRMGVCGYTG